jgi:hypothetical protein
MFTWSSPKAEVPTAIFVLACHVVSAAESSWTAKKNAFFAWFDQMSPIFPLNEISDEMSSELTVVLPAFV